MDHKCWQTWMKFYFVYISFLATSTADFTTECQRPCDCRWQSGNKAAICSNSSLRTIPTNLSNDIQILDLSNNHLQQLQQEAFKKVGLSNLKKLFLRECNIETVHKASFATLAIMIELDLSKNKIQYLAPETFRNTEKLRLINLNNNFIDKLEDGLFRNLKFLQKVELSNNRIQRIGTKAFVNLPQLKILRIDGNSLSHMKPETLMGLHNLSGLDLHNNPWRCDCNLQTFREWVISHNLYTPPTSCSEPAVVKDKLWNELDSSNFACRPTILEPIPDSTISSYDDNVTLICKVVGNPNPEVTWRFNGRNIEPKSFGEIRYVIAENTMDLIRWVNLTILYARYSDRGNYTCVAENPGGKDEKTLTLVHSKYGGGFIAGMRSDSFAILIGCLTATVIIFVAVIAVCHFTGHKQVSKRLMKIDNRSTNDEALIEGSVNSEGEKVVRTEVNPVSKPPRKYEAAPSVTSETTEMTNRTILDSESVIACNEDISHQQHVEFPKLTKDFFIDRLSQDHQYPPDLLSFPYREEAQVSPASSSAAQDKPRSNQTYESPKSPAYGVSSTQVLFTKYTPVTSQSSLLSPKAGYVTLPRRPKINWNESHNPFGTINGVLPYYDSFKSNGSNYYSLNKSEIDLGPVQRLSSHFQDSEEFEPAPSPAPGTPHGTIPRNSLSSPNIHNQLMALQAMSLAHRARYTDQRPLKVTLTENEKLLKNVGKDLRVGYSVNVVSDNIKNRTAPKPPPKPRKRNSSDVMDTFLLNSKENATQV